MSDFHYRQLPAGPTDNNADENSFMKQKILGITIKEYLLFFGSILAVTLLNMVFRDYLYKLSLDLILHV